MGKGNWRFAFIFILSTCCSRAGSGEIQPLSPQRLPSIEPADSATSGKDVTVLPDDASQIQLVSFDDGRQKLDWFLRNVDVNGHVRVRQETDMERIGRPTRNRQRLRARLGFTLAMTEEVQAGIRFTTGDRKQVLESGDRQGSPLSYQNTGDVFDKFEFNLDRIFIDYRPKSCPNLFITGGKFRSPIKLNPIFSDPIGDLVWDEAAHPEGIAGGYTWSDSAWLDQITWTLGETAVLELGNADEASLFFTQVWTEKNIGRVNAAAGVAWYDWHNLNPDRNTRISAENNSGNALVSIGPNPEDVIFASQFSIINPMVVATFGEGEEGGPFHPVQVVWEGFHNTKSFDTRRDFGYSVGMQYGPAVTRSRAMKRGDWKVYCTWQEVQQESVLTPVAQDDFLRATNFRGSWIGGDYFVRDNVEVRCWILTDRPILPITAGGEIDLVNGTKQNEWRIRLDATAYF